VGLAGLLGLHTLHLLHIGAKVFTLYCIWGRTCGPDLFWVFKWQLKNEPNLIKNENATQADFLEPLINV
jgi:hypothetical protein